MSSFSVRLRRARGPLTGIALLFIGASIAVYLSTAPKKEPQVTIAPTVSEPLAASTTLPSVPTPPESTDPTEPETTDSETTTTEPPVSEPETTSPATTAPRTTTTASTRPATTTTAPRTTVPSATTIPATTTIAPKKVSWQNVIPSLPGGGTATLIEGTDYRYAVSISYPGYAPADLVSAMRSAFTSAGWSVTGTPTLTVSKSNVKGTIAITSSGSGSKAVMDLKSIG